MNSRPDKTVRTDPPKDGVPVVLYDGHCPFCASGARWLAGAAKGRFVLRSFHDEGVLSEFAGLSRQALMREMKLIDSTGRVYGGAEAVVQAVSAGYPSLGKLLRVYYLPGIRRLADALYRWVAKSRYRLCKRPPEDGGADACPRHKV